MSETGDGVFVCGFGDVAAGIGGLAWDLAGPGALLLSRGQVREGTFALEQGGDALTLAIEAGDEDAEASLLRRIEHVIEDGDDSSRLSASACRAEVRSRGGKGTDRCFGHVWRWTGGLRDVSTLRALTIEDGDAVLTAVARGGPGSVPHGEERTSAWRVNDASVVTFDQALISTQYDGDGHPTRIGLELWPEDADHSSRAGATRVAGSLIGGVEASGIWAGLFRCHTDGNLGLGSYLLRRA